jgi:tripartite-type tricarboxylate transporter receptor subunit TctC
VKKLSEIGAEPGALSGAAFGAFLRSEAEKWGKVAMSAGVKLD